MRAPVLAALIASYAAAVLWATARPGPRAWSLHLPAFLQGSERTLLLLLLVLGTAVVGARAVARVERPAHPPGRQAIRPSDSPSRRRRGGPRRGTPHRTSHRAPSMGWPAWAPFALLLPAYGATLWLLRVRTYFLGDGIVWRNGLLGGTAQPFNEPLAELGWKGFLELAVTLGLPRSESTLALLPALCGMGAALLLVGIVREAIAEPGARRVAWAIALLAGFTQLYFGYLESYPLASVAVLLVLWLALRHVRGAGAPWLLGTALAVSIGLHLVTLYLVPAYTVAVLRRPGSTSLKAALLVLPLAAAVALLRLTGMEPRDLIEPFRAAARLSAMGTVPAHLARPYGVLSLAHAFDLANAALLAAAVPALILIARAASDWRTLRPPRDPGAQVLAVAAASGLFLAAALKLPVAPAQDWDLTAMMLLPLAIAGTVAGVPFYRDRGLAMGLAAVSTASLLSFVLVNARVESGIARYRTLLDPNAPISAYARGYGHSMLSEHFEDHGDLVAALAHAELALRAEETNPRYWVRAGTILYNQGQYEEASARLREAIRRGTRRAEAYHNLGLCEARLGRPGEAVGLLAAAVTVDGGRPEYWHNWGLLLYQTGNVDSAKVVWTETLRRWPGYALTRRSFERRFGATSPPK